MTVVSNRASALPEALPFTDAGTGSGTAKLAIRARPDQGPRRPFGRRSVLDA
jgi:hypothetical protein